MAAPNAAPSQDDGIALFEGKIAELGEEIKTLVETRNQEATAEVRDSLGKDIEGLKADLAKVEGAMKEARDAVISGVEVTDTAEKDKFSFARFFQASAAAGRKGGPGNAVWNKSEYGYEKAYLDEVQDRVATGKVKTHTGATDSAGGYLIGTEVMSGILDLLRARSVAYDRGVRRMDSLSSNLSFVRNAGGTTAYWIDTEAEEEITESTGSFVNINARPHPLACLLKATWGMLNQPAQSIEAYVREEAAKILALEEDKAIFSGTGAAGQPKGILNVTGISTNDLSDLGTYSETIFGIGAAPSAETARDAQAYFRGFPQALRANNAMGQPGARLGWVTEPEVAEELEAVMDADGRSLFLSDEAALIDSLYRYPISVTTNMTQTAGGDADDRQILFGDFNQCLVPHWGATEFRVGEEGDDFKKARVSFRMISAMDVVVLQPSSFVKATNYDEAS